MDTFLHLLSVGHAVSDSVAGAFAPDGLRDRSAETSQETNVIYRSTAVYQSLAEFQESWHSPRPPPVEVGFLEILLRLLLFKMLFAHDKDC